MAFWDSRSAILLCSSAFLASKPFTSLAPALTKISFLIADNVPFISLTGVSSFTSYPADSYHALTAARVFSSRSTYVWVSLVPANPASVPSIPFTAVIACSSICTPAWACSIPLSSPFTVASAVWISSCRCVFAASASAFAVRSFVSASASCFVVASFLLFNSVFPLSSWLFLSASSLRPSVSSFLEFSSSALESFNSCCFWASSASESASSFFAFSSSACPS